MITLQARKKGVLPFVDESIDALKFIQGLNGIKPSNDVFPVNEDGYIVSYINGEFARSQLHAAYSFDHCNTKTDDEINDYVERVEKEYTKWFEKQSQKENSVDTKNYKLTFASSDSLHKAFEKQGMKITHNEAVEYFNAFKLDNQLPAKKKGLGTGKYNREEMKEYNTLCDDVKKFEFINEHINLFKDVLAKSNENIDGIKDYLINYEKVIGKIDLNNKENIFKFVKDLGSENINFIYELVKEVNTSYENNMKELKEQILAKNVTEQLDEGENVDEEHIPIPSVTRNIQRKNQTAELTLKGKESLVINENGFEIEVETPNNEIPSRTTDLNTPNSPEQTHNNYLRKLAQEKKLVPIIKKAIEDENSTEYMKLVELLLGKYEHAVDITNEPIDVIQLTNEDLTKIKSGVIDRDIKFMGKVVSVE